jgi:hypothetical protein
VIVTSSANGYINPVCDYTTPTSAQFHGPEKWNYGTTTVAVAGRLSTIKKARYHLRRWYPTHRCGRHRFRIDGEEGEVFYAHGLAQRVLLFAFDIRNRFFYGFAESRLNAPPAVTASLPRSLEQPRSLPDIGDYFRWQLSEHPGSDYGPLYDRRCCRLSYFWPRF